MSGGSRRAIFLDRDGVINRAVVRDGKPHPPATLAELDIPADVPPALRAASSAGFVLIGVTNQPDVARGLVTQDVVDAIHRRILETTPLVDILVCTHDDRDRCDCRKPLPGMLLRAAERYGIDLRASYMVGDRWRDVEAGRRAGCTTVWIDRGYHEAWPVAAPDHAVASLPEAVEWILRSAQRKESHEDAR